MNARMNLSITGQRVDPLRQVCMVRILQGQFLLGLSFSQDIQESDGLAYLLVVRQAAIGGGLDDFDQLGFV